MTPPLYSFCHQCGEYERVEDDDRDDDQEGLTDIDADQLAREIEDLDDVDEWGSSE